MTTLFSPNRTTFKTFIDSLDLMRFLFCMLPLLVSAHDNNCHYEEANVSKENQYHWSNNRPNERCRRIQIAAAKRELKISLRLL
jgi:hypothetical protein